MKHAKKKRPEKGSCLQNITICLGTSKQTKSNKEQKAITKGTSCSKLYAKLCQAASISSGGFLAEQQTIPKAGTIIRAETPPLKTKNWKYNLHTMNKFARKNRYLASSTYGDKPSVPNAPSASINGSSLRRIAPAQTHSSHPWVDWRRSWKTEKGKQNSISPCDNIQQNALCLSTWS